MIQLYNTLTRQKEIFKPIKAEVVGIYTCGPTVYDKPHIGNLRAYIFTDTLHRLFKSQGYELKHLINITDVGHLTQDADIGQDKIELSAKTKGKSVQKIVQFYTNLFFANLTDLNINLSEYEFPKASDHIAEQIALIKILETKGYTYQTSDGLYFDTTKYPNYAELGKLNLTAEKKSRLAFNSEKKHEADFALWKFSNPEDHREQEWPSPWGTGFPGWHIECSAMSLKYLGETFDIHTGGIDHIPIHHTNERAQSESATEKPQANYWLHNEFLTIKDKKMAKSDGGFITLDDLKEAHIPPLALRYLFLTTHYRKNLNFSWEALTGAEQSLKKLNQAMLALSNNSIGLPIKHYLETFNTSLENDLNTAEALGIVWQLIDDASINPNDKKATLLYFNDLLGLGLDDIKQASIPDSILALVKDRAEARKNKDWSEADRLRNLIIDQGFEVIDQPDNTQELRSINP